MIQLCVVQYEEHVSEMYTCNLYCLTNQCHPRNLIKINVIRGKMKIKSKETIEVIKVNMAKYSYNYGLEKEVFLYL